MPFSSSTIERQTPSSTCLLAGLSVYAEAVTQIVLSPGNWVGPFKVITPIGDGGMGIVFKAEDTRSGRLVALKFLSGRLAQSPQALARFQREARAASALDHPNICTIHDIGEYEG